MSNTPVFVPPASSERPRPVSLFTTVFVLALFAAFFFVVRYFYQPADVAPQNAAAENLPKELQWRATSDSRRAALNELRQEHARQATSYAWVDQKAGIVRLPIERAMDLTVERYGGKQPAREPTTPRQGNR